MHEELLVGLALIATLAVGGQVVAARLRLPSILVLLVLGIIAGPLTGVLDPDALLGDLIFPIVSLAVAIILFEGGLLLNVRELGHGVSAVVRRLIVIGVPVTAVAAALTSTWLLGLDPAVAAILGAILTVSGPTVVLPLLRFIKPSESVRTVLKWEGIVVDAVGAALAVIAFDAVIATGDAPGPAVAVLEVALTLAVGGIVGALGALALVWLLDHDAVESRLEPVVTIMLVVAAFVASDLVRTESGLLAAIVMGVVLANQGRVSVHRVEQFKESLGALLTGTLFIILSARLELDALTGEVAAALALVAVLVLLVRPAATLLATIGSPFSLRERLLMAWMAPRGIVAAATASVFTFELVEAGVADAGRLTPLVFLVILLTVAIYGLTGGPAARLLGVTAHDDESPHEPDTTDPVTLPNGG